MDVAPLDRQVLGDLSVSARALLAASGAEWSFSVDGPWAFATPVGARSPAQGWKLHVSATEASAADVLAAALPVLVAEAVPFKFAAGHTIVRLLNSTHADRASGGKFITIYPADDGQAVRVAEACHRATDGLAGPVILSDRAYRPGSLVHYRYGGFSAAPAVDNDGVVVHLIKGPDGTPLPDERTASYRAPSWLADPFNPENRSPAAAGATNATATAPAAAGVSVVLNDRYRVQGALSHANKGGTYLAEDAATGALVVIKEGRPHVGDEGQGDARARVRHEARMLDLVARVGRSPRLVEVFEQGGHVFLVEEYVDAPSLRDVVEGEGDGPMELLPAGEVVALAAALAETLAAFHAAGVVVGDFNPNNILVTDNGRPGKLYVIDLEHARPAGEPPAGPAGTPGYASPEQLQGGGDGVSDDTYGLGATIAFLATGADPFVPARADDTWSDPARLAEWLGAQVAAGSVDAALAGLALGAMAPRPADRSSPDAVLATLRGEGSRTAPGCGGRAPTGRTDSLRPYGSVEERAALVVADLGGWLVDTMGSGPGGHLWPAGAAASTLDPIAVQAGASGVGLFLARLVRATGALPGPAQARLDEAGLREALGATAGWVVDQLARTPQRPPGLYFGTSGVAWFLADAAEALGRDDLLRRANELALTLPVRVPNSDITHGTAGIGLGQLRQWVATGDDRFLARAVVAAEQILRAAHRGDGADGVTWPVPAGAPTRLAGTVSYGYAHGNAGIASFLLGLSAATGEPEFAEVAIEALVTFLGKAVTVDGAGYWPASPDTESDVSETGYWPSWCNGSSGMGTAFLRAQLLTGDAGFRRAAEGAARAGLRERWLSTSGQCHGLAGDAELLLDLADLPAREAQADCPYRAAARTAAEALLLQRRTSADHRGTVFADDSGATVSAGFGTGVAGTGAFLLRLVAGGPRPLLLDELFEDLR